MDNYILPVQIRWADLDPNFHFRHSVYYDWGSMCRFEFLREKGLTAAFMQKQNFGPVILREECVFRKEINYDDQVSIDLRLLKSRRDYSRWSFIHAIRKNGNTVCAQVTIDGAWLHTQERKLITAPAEVVTVYQQMPKDEQFQWLD